jgi:homoserine O-acetyltransferase
MADLDLASSALNDGGTWRFPASEPLRLDSGGVIEGLEIAYQHLGR